MKKDLYSTSDIGLATALSLHFPVNHVDRKNPNKVSFIFTLSKDLEDMVELYWKKELQVDAQSYYLQSTALKTMIYERT